MKYPVVYPFFKVDVHIQQQLRFKMGAGLRCLCVMNLETISAKNDGLLGGLLLGCQSPGWNSMVYIISFSGS